MQTIQSRTQWPIKFNGQLTGSQHVNSIFSKIKANQDSTFAIFVFEAQEELEALLWICFTLRCIFSIFEEKISKTIFVEKNRSIFGRKNLLKKIDFSNMKKK